MTIAFTFPGQGSQAVGMGKDLADAYPEARAVFDEVDDALGQKLSDIIWNGPEETLTLTANAQPALKAVSIAASPVIAQALSINFISSIFNAGSFMTVFPFIVRRIYEGDAFLLSMMMVVFYCGATTSSLAMMRFMPFASPIIWAAVV